MKTIYSSKRLTVRIPSTRTDWICIFLALAGVYNLIAGDGHAALDMLQLALLFDILGRLPESP